MSGGWGIDALLGVETRPHKDLDVIMLLDDVDRLRELLGYDGYHLKELWSENRWAIDAQGAQTATAFVLQDAAGRELDAHAMRFNERGNGVPAWEAPNGFIFKWQNLMGVGMIAGFAVQWITPEQQMLSHTGYALPETHLRDVVLLHEKFGVEYPDENSGL